MSIGPHQAAGFSTYVGRIIREMSHNIELGMRPNLAAAFAIGQVKLAMTAKHPPKPFTPAERRQVRFIQALSIAVDYYGGELAKQQLGAEGAAAMQAEFLQLLTEFGSN